MTDVVVVGGGIAGLVAARDLAKGGANVVLIEASDRLGGMIRSHTVAGLDLDMGADSYATRTDAVERLAIELGLGSETVTPDPRGAWLMTRDGRVAPIPATGLLGIPSTPMAADVIAVIGRSGAFRAQLDALLPGPVGSRATTLGALVRRRMGDAVLDDLVVPVAAGVHSTHPDQLPVERVAPKLVAAMQREGSLARAVLALRERAPAGSAVAGIRGGVHRLADELIADMETYHVAVRTSTTATAIERAAVDIVGPDGSAERLVADTVVSTVVDPGRRTATSGPGTTAGGAPIDLVTLVVDQPELDAAPRGTGMLAHPDAPGVRAKALTHATVKWPWLADAADGRHVLRLSSVGSGGNNAPVGISTPLRSDDDRVRSAAADASAMLGVRIDPARVDGAALVRWRAADTAGAGLTDGVIGVGEVSAGRGLAAVVGASREAAASILDT